jgi:hypothetical protein
MEISMPRVAHRIPRLLPAVAATLLLLGAAGARAEQKAPVRPGQHANAWTSKTGVRYETRSTDWHGGRKAEWERRVTGKSGITKITGMSWGSKVKGTARTFKNGNTLERLTVTADNGEVRKVTTRTLAGGVVLKTIRMPDGTRREITTWTEKGTAWTETRELDKAGEVTSTKRTSSPVAAPAATAAP